ncbi:MAG: phytanoyl-CoA dioxygenase family protein [Azospirillaceae bacterium]
MLSPEEIDRYRRDGFLLVENALSGDEVAAMRAEIARIVERARGLEEGDDVFEFEDGHSPDAPRVRRIKKPHQVAPFFRDLLAIPRVIEPVTDLLGPNVRLQSSKLNMKSAEYGASVEWHQDWAFYPHTNDDILAIGIFVDDVDTENGPLMAVPGSHRGPVLDHHHGGVFCGAVDPGAEGVDLDRAVRLTGPAGSMSIHHVRTLHGSDFNRSGRSRGLLLYELTAADAWPLVGTMSPFGGLEEYDGRMVAGEPTLAPRLESVPVRMPLPMPADVTSIYQAQKRAGQKAFT